MTYKEEYEDLKQRVLDSIEEGVDKVLKIGEFTIYKFEKETRVDHTDFSYSRRLDSLKLKQLIKLADDK